MEEKKIYGEFRGSEEEIKNRLKKYLEYFTDCEQVLDVGCGRGEFLSLLREHHVPAMGLDLDPEMVKLCREKGLNVVNAEVNNYLRKQEKNFDGIFCSQVIEHMDSREAEAFLDLCWDRLNYGGTLVIVTLNPRNIRVVTNIFWMDLTHKRLYPLPLLENLLAMRGLEIIASGDDLDTIKRGAFWNMVRRIDIKLSRGTFFSGVDIFVVGKKPLRVNRKI